MLTKLLDKTLDGVIKWTEDFFKLFNDHNHDGRNSKKPSDTGDIYTDLGDISDYQFKTATIDAGWHDWDLSAIIPAGTKLVKLKVQMRGDTVAHVIQVRKNGNSNDASAQWFSNLSANNYIYYEALVPIGTDLIIEYKIPVSFNVANFAILGYWT